ncbi:MAG: 50S ribosomal protein L25, partial [Limisphaerales bacterium]
TVVHQSASELLLLDLSIDGSNRLALVKEIQHHPMKRNILHVDLHEVAEGDKVTATVPVEAVGEAVGVKTGGGVLEHVLFKIKVRATPKDLPEVLNVDVTNLEVGKSLHLGEIPLPPGVEALGKKDIPVFAVAAPVAEAAATGEGAAPGTAEVEMIKEKKDAGKAAPAPAKAAAKKK